MMALEQLCVLLCRDASIETIPQDGGRWEEGEVRDINSLLGVGGCRDVKIPAALIKILCNFGKRPVLYSNRTS